MGLRSSDEHASDYTDTEREVILSYLNTAIREANESDLEALQLGLEAHLSSCNAQNNKTGAYLYKKLIQLVEYMHSRARK